MVRTYQWGALLFAVWSLTFTSACQHKENSSNQNSSSKSNDDEVEEEDEKTHKKVKRKKKTTETPSSEAPTTAPSDDPFAGSGAKNVVIQTGGSKVAAKPSVTGTSAVPSTAPSATAIVPSASPTVQLSCPPGFGRDGNTCRRYCAGTCPAPYVCRASPSGAMLCYKQ